jgi:N utilization substance protein B
MTSAPTRQEAREALRRRRAAARLYAVQALFQMEVSGQTTDAVEKEFEDFRFGATTPEGAEMEEGDVDLFRALVDGAVNEQARIDQMTDRALVAAWPIDRIDPTLRALFRAGGAELMADRTPPKVVITEFVEIARAFFPEGREPRFVNAVLDHMAREARPEAF